MHENMYYPYGKSVNSAIIIVSKYLSLHNLLSLCKVGQDRYVPLFVIVIVWLKIVYLLINRLLLYYYGLQIELYLSNRSLIKSYKDIALISQTQTEHSDFKA